MYKEVKNKGEVGLFLTARRKVMRAHTRLLIEQSFLAADCFGAHSKWYWAAEGESWKQKQGKVGRETINIQIANLQRSDSEGRKQKLAASCGKTDAQENTLKED